jgi:hypothetical protein
MSVACRLSQTLGLANALAAKSCSPYQRQITSSHFHGWRSPGALCRRLWSIARLSMRQFAVSASEVSAQSNVSHRLSCNGAARAVCVPNRAFERIAFGNRSISTLGVEIHDCTSSQHCHWPRDCRSPGKSSCMGRHSSNLACLRARNSFAVSALVT